MSLMRMFDVGCCPRGGGRTIVCMCMCMCMCMIYRVQQLGLIMKINEKILLFSGVNANRGRGPL
jgi:hypothetical protein